jgi:hypothetical protein
MQKYVFELVHCVGFCTNIVQDARSTKYKIKKFILSFGRKLDGKRIILEALGIEWRILKYISYKYTV